MCVRVSVCVCVCVCARARALELEGAIFTSCPKVCLIVSNPSHVFFIFQFAEDVFFYDSHLVCPFFSLSLFFFLSFFFFNFFFLNFRVVVVAVGFFLFLFCLVFCWWVVGGGLRRGNCVVG